MTTELTRVVRWTNVLTPQQITDLLTELDHDGVDGSEYWTLDDALGSIECTKYTRQHGDCFRLTGYENFFRVNDQGNGLWAREDGGGVVVLQNVSDGTYWVASDSIVNSI